MAQFQGNFRPVSDVYDLKSDKREFRANANIMHDLLGHEAALTQEVGSHLLVAGFTRAPHPRQQIKSADDPTGKGAKSSRGWFVPPKLSLAGVNTGGETPETPAALATDRVGDTDQLRMPLQAPLSEPELEVEVRDGSAQPAALSGAQEAEQTIASDTYSDVAAILTAANEPIVANANLSDPSIMFTRAASSFDLSKRPSGLRVVEGSAAAFALMDVTPVRYVEAANEHFNTSNEKLVYALAWASLGVKGFALSDSKTPLKGSHGFLDATTDASVLKGMFAPKERCFAISNYETDAPDFDLLMFDNDQKPAEVDKPAKDGLAVFGKIEAEVGHKFPATYTERTPSGGGRRLYKVPKGTTVGLKRNQINFLSERYGIHGLDIPNYCVMAPSVTAKGRYTVVDDQPVQWLEGNLLEFIVAHIGKRGEHVMREGDTHVEDGDYSSLAVYSGQLADEVKEAIEAIDFSQINRHQWLAVGARAILCGCTGVFMQKTTDKANSSYSSGDENILQECVKLTADIQAQPEAERFGVVFKLAGKNPSYVNPKSRKAQQRSDVPEGMAVVAGSEEAFGSRIKLDITTESLLHGIHQVGDEAWQSKLKGSTEYRHSAAWFASGVLNGDQGKVLAYQTMYPMRGDGKPRNLVVGDRIDWSAAVYTAAMHIAGDVVIQNGNKHVSNFSELTQASKDRLTAQVVELFEASKIKGVWDVPATAGTMRDTITNAVRAFKIKSNSAKTASNKTDTLPAATVAPATPATPAVYAGFDLSRPPDTLTGKANGFVSGGVVAPPAAMGVSVPVQTVEAVPATFGFTPKALPDNVDPVSGGRLDVLPQSLGRLDVKRPHGKSWEDHRDDVCAWMNKYFAKVMYGGKAALATLVYNDAMQTYNYAYYKPKELAALYSQKKIQIGVDGADRPVMAPITSAFANWEGTPSYDRVVCDSRGAGIGAFNTWRGFSVAPAEGNDKIWRILSHIKEVLCDGNEEVYTYTLDWIASGFQKPEDRGGSALVWKGLKGTGKGMIGNMLCEMWGYHALHVTQKDHIVGKFNGHLEDKRFLFADEAFFAGDKANEGVLKGLITEPRLMIERKGFDAVERPNYIHILIVSNDDFVVPATRDERRYCVTTVNPKYKDNFEYFGALDNDVKDKEVQAAFLYFMLHRDISKYRAGKIPETEALAEQRAENADSTSTWMMRCLQEGGFYSRDATGGHYLGWKDEMSASELYASYLDWIRDEGGVKHKRPKTTTAFGKYVGTLFPRRLAGKSASRAWVYTLGTADEAIKVFEKHEKLKVSF